MALTTTDPVVVDTSALLNVMARLKPNHVLVDRMSSATLHAPHLIDVELLHGLRGMVLRSELSVEKAQRARQYARQTRITRYPLGGYADRVWELRDCMTAHDASYVALAEVLDVPLITSDARLARSSGHRATIELFTGS